MKKEDKICPVCKTKLIKLKHSTICACGNKIMKDKIPS
ncbi:hypothetical protein J2S16_001130 [Cytobacillus kochii]|nr:hypothetical protein [Cytobacillus kochii]